MSPDSPMNDEELAEALDDRLDEALEESFPASDPLAVYCPEGDF